MPEHDGRGRDGVRADERSSASTSSSVLEALVFASPEPITPKQLFKLLNDEPKEDVQAALARARGALRRARRRAAGRAGRRRLPDRHAARARRVGAADVPRAHHAEALAPGARDAGGHRLQAADHRRRDHRDPVGQHLGRHRHAARARPRQDQRPQAGRRAGRSSTPRRASSSIASASATSRTCRRSRTWPAPSASSRPSGLAVEVVDTLPLSDEPATEEDVAVLTGEGADDDVAAEPDDDDDERRASAKRQTLNVQTANVQPLMVSDVAAVDPRPCGR